MILAAGRGERMRPLTDTTPKPLLMVAGKPIIQYTIEQLVAAGFDEIVINIAYLGQQIKQVLGDGQQFNASICYSDETDTPLETAGGITKALPLLGDKPFLVVNGDIAHDYPLHTLHNKKIDLAHLILIANPAHHPEGDFYIAKNQLLSLHGKTALTYSGIGLYHPTLFQHNALKKIKLVSLLCQAITKKHISAEQFNGFWMDIGTPKQLKTLDALRTTKAG